jgi:WD40 repeat protein
MHALFQGYQPLGITGVGDRGSRSPGDAVLVGDAHQNPLPIHQLEHPVGPDGKRLASASGDKTVKVWDAQTVRETLALKGHTGGINSVAFSPDSKHLASASEDQTVKAWDASAAP